MRYCYQILQNWEKTVELGNFKCGVHEIDKRFVSAWIEEGTKESSVTIQLKCPEGYSLSLFNIYYTWVDEEGEHLEVLTGKGKKTL